MRVLKMKDLAAMLGCSVDTARKRIKRMQAQGFPARDDTLNGWLDQDVQAWLSGRRRVTGSTFHTMEVNTDAL